MDDFINIQKEETVYVAKNDGCYSIRKIDWDRIKRMVDQPQTKEVSYSIYYSILFGVAGSSGVSILPIAFSNNLPSWVAPTDVITTLACLLVAIIFKSQEKNTRTERKAKINEIKTEMDEIEKLYHPK